MPPRPRAPAHTSATCSRNSTSIRRPGGVRYAVCRIRSQHRLGRRQVEGVLTDQCRFLDHEGLRSCSAGESTSGSTKTPSVTLLPSCLCWEFSLTSVEPRVLDPVVNLPCARDVIASIRAFCCFFLKLLSMAKTIKSRVDFARLESSRRETSFHGVVFPFSVDPTFSI